MGSVVALSFLYFISPIQSFNTLSKMNGSKISNFSNFQKYLKEIRKSLKFEKKFIFEINSEVRIALRVPPAETRLTVYRRFETYWCVGKPRPKGTATFYDVGLFEHVYC